MRDFAASQTDSSIDVAERGLAATAALLLREQGSGHIDLGGTAAPIGSVITHRERHLGCFPYVMIGGKGRPARGGGVGDFLVSNGVTGVCIPSRAANLQLVYAPEHSNDSKRNSAGGQCEDR